MHCDELTTPLGRQASLTVLVVGVGAEDAQTALGAVVSRLAFGQDAVRVIGFDYRAATDSCDSEGPDFVLSWLVRQEAPALLLAVEEDGAHAAAHDHAITVLPTSHDAALGALTRWAVALLGEDAPESTVAAVDVDGVYAALSGLHTGVPALLGDLVVRERHPRVSEVICVYNQERFLHQTMQSVLASTYDDYEVIVVDDGSTDASPAILEQYVGDPRVHVVRHENLGRTGRMDLVHHRGIRAARGDLIAFLGGDDNDVPERLSAQVAAFDDDPGLGVCHSASWAIDAGGIRRGTGIALKAAYDELSFLRLMLRGNLVGIPTVMMSRKAMTQQGPLEDGIAADMHYWYKSGGRVRFRYLPQRLVEYRYHDKALSTTEAGSVRCARAAHRSRRLVFSRRTLTDVYPELIGTPDPSVWADAALELGNHFATTSEPQLAMRYYDEGHEMSRDPRLLHNQATILAALGDGVGALRIAESLSAVFLESRMLAEGLRAGGRFDASLFQQGAGLARVIEAGRLRNGAGAKNWDGSPVRSRSAYVAVAPHAEALGPDLLEAWAVAADLHPELRWVYPDLGADTIDVRAPRSVRRERVEDLSILPPDARRLTGLVRAPRDVSAFRSWLQVPA